MAKGGSFERANVGAKIRSVAASMRELADAARHLTLDSFYVLARRRDFGPTSNTVALIRLDNIGDYVLWSSCADEYRRSFSDRKTHLFCNAACFDLARREPWDAITAVDVQAFKRDTGYRWSIFDKLREVGPRTVINPTFSRTSWKDDALVRMSRAQERIGQRGDTSNTPFLAKLVSDRFYTSLVDTPDVSHELAANSAFAAGVLGKQIAPKLPHITGAPAAPASVGERYAVLFPGSSWSGRAWPAARFAEIGKRLEELGDCRIVICGGASDAAAAEAINRFLPSVVNLAGQTSLVELTSILQRAVIVVSNETSAAHIAAAVQTPVVCVTGGGHFGRFVPYPETGEPTSMRCVEFAMPCFGCNWNCIFSTARNAAKPCVDNISVEQVWGAVRGLLGVGPACAA
jgi:ADP-heptose:LPS heptosyltransferase